MKLVDESESSWEKGTNKIKIDCIRVQTQKFL